MPLRIVSREEWSWVPSTPVLENVRRFNRVFIQNAYIDPCEDEERCQERMRQLLIKHVKMQSFEDIRFNFLVGEDGNVYEGRGWNVSPVLPRKFYRMRLKSMLIGFLGNYSSESTPEQIDDATSDLIKYGVREGHISVDYHYYDIMQMNDRHHAGSDDM